MEKDLTHNFLILGSNSFSGSSFANTLLDQGFNVVGVSRQAEISPPYSRYFGNANLKNFTFIQHDLNADPKKIVDLCKVHEITVIVNFAAQSMVGESWKFPTHWYETNVVSLARLVEALGLLGGQMPRFVQFTTPEVYGSTTGWIGESFNFSPTTPYAISRAAGDFHLKAMHQSQNFPVIFTRAANVYGEHQRAYRIIPRAFIAALTKSKFPLHGGGHSERSFIHIDDVSEALLRIAVQGALGTSYHISTNELVSIRTVVAKCAQMLGLRLEDICELSDDRLGKDAAYMLDSSKLRAELGWVDSIDLNEGLQRTLKWAEENLNIILDSEREYIHRR
jgi:dTDP-glucose 4,6-dehydratase